MDSEEAIRLGLNYKRFVSLLLGPQGPGNPLPAAAECRSLQDIQIRDAKAKFSALVLTLQLEIAAIGITLWPNVDSRNLVEPRLAACKAPTTARIRRYL